MNKKPLFLGKNSGTEQPIGFIRKPIPADICLFRLKCLYAILLKLNYPAITVCAKQQLF